LKTGLSNDKTDGAIDRDLVFHFQIDQRFSFCDRDHDRDLKADPDRSGIDFHFKIDPRPLFHKI
jgi:hypothetical protein